MRICALLPAYSIFSFLAVCFPNAYVYLVAWLDLFQSIALCGFFFLLCNFLNPDEDARCMFLASYRPKKGKMSSKNMNGLMWFQVCPDSINARISLTNEPVLEKMALHTAIPSRGSLCCGGKLYHSVRRCLLS
jgi:hypothetical protein